MFHPTLGRWLQEDPIDFEANDPNLYRYVENNPVTQVDPSGLFGVPSSFLVQAAGPLFRSDNGNGKLPSLSNDRQIIAPYNYLGVLYGNDKYEFQPAGAGSFRVKSSRKEVLKTTFKQQSVNLGGIVVCGVKLTFDVEISIKFGRMFVENPTGSRKFPVHSTGDMILITVIQKQYSNVKLNIGGNITPIGDFWQRIGVITPREGVYVSAGPTSKPGSRFHFKPVDANSALKLFTIDDTSTDMESELQKLYQFLINLK